MYSKKLKITIENHDPLYKDDSGITRLVNYITLDGLLINAKEIIIESIEGEPVKTFF